jgi:hypothetical protein
VELGLLLAWVCISDWYVHSLAIFLAVVFLAWL